MRSRILDDNLNLTEYQKEVLVGFLLGDGFLERRGNARATSLKVCQSLKQLEFVEWLHKIFINFTRTPPRIKTRQRNGKQNFEVVFNTLSHPCFNYFHTLFYPSGKKVIPENIDQFLTPTALTVWFMGDGSVKSKECRGRILNTQSFSREEIDRLIIILKDKFDLKSNIRSQKDGLQIYISGKSAEILNALLKDNILPSFYYKLPLKS
jgi:hypothetical protein